MILLLSYKDILQTLKHTLTELLIAITIYSLSEM